MTSFSGGVPEITHEQLSLLPPLDYHHTTAPKEGRKSGQKVSANLWGVIAWLKTGLPHFNELHALLTFTS